MKSLKEVYEPYFKVGAAVNRRSVHSHGELLIKHFNSITCENEMKTGSLYGADGGFNPSGADEIYNFAVDNEMGVRGHTLIWHNQMPRFYYEEKDRDRAFEHIKSHMKTMSERYGGVYAWDAVNEAVEDKTDAYLRETWGRELFGEDYIAEMFRLAGGFFPDATLYYNDYNETSPRKREKIARLVRGMREQGVPVGGVGMQAHYNIYSPSHDEIKEAIELYAGLGVKVSITEMDVSLFAFGDSSQLPDPATELLEKQAAYYAECFKIFREYSEHIESVTLWGVADDMTWLDHFPVRARKNKPLLFDEEHNPKEAFLRVVDF
jgi:endo-1,4-beta-xylanase